MPQTVEIPGQGTVDFPDSMTPDEIKGVIKTKFFSESPPASTEQPPPAATPTALPEPTGPGEQQPLSTAIGKILGKGINTAVEASGGILPPEIQQQIFGKTDASLSEEERSKPLLSPEVAASIVGQLPTYAGGGSKFSEGLSEAAAGALSEFSKPSAIAQLPAFAVPGVAEVTALNTAAEIPKQVKGLRDTFRESGILSKEAGAAIGEAGIQDALGLLVGKEGVGGRFIKTGREIGRAEVAKPAEAEAPIPPAVAAEIAGKTAEEAPPPPAAPESATIEAAPTVETAPPPAAPTLTELSNRLNAAQREMRDAQASGDAERITKAQSDLQSSIDDYTAETMGKSNAAKAEANANVTVNPEVNSNREVTDETVFDPSDTEMAKKAAESVGATFDRVVPDSDSIQVTDKGTGSTFEMPKGSTFADFKAKIDDYKAKEAEILAKKSKQNRSFQIPYAPSGQPDILDIITENGGMKSRTGAGEAGAANGSLWDDQPDLRGVYRQLLGGKLAPDQMAEIAAEHGFGDGSLNSFWKLVDDTVKGRRSFREQSVNQIKQASVAARQAKAFDKDVAQPNLEKTPINTTNLEIGTKIKVGEEEFKVTHFDPDTLDITLEDGRKYGVQTVKLGDVLYVDKAELTPREQDLAPGQSLPKLRAGENQGDLLSNQTEDLTLRGETGTDYGEIARRKAESEAALEKQDAENQTKLFRDETSADEQPIGSLAATGGQPLGPQPVQISTRPIKSQRQIITDLSKALGVPTRFGRLRTSKFGGYFMSKQNLIAMKRANWVPGTAHEFGHKLDREFEFRKDKTLRSELEMLGDPQTPGSMSSWTKSKTNDYKYGEGVAEFVRYWLTDPAKAQQVAPNMRAVFEKMLNANKDVGDTFRQAQSDIQVWRSSEPQARLRSQISIGENPNKTRYTLSQATRDIVDDLHFLNLATDYARKHGADIPPSKDPYMLARNLRGSFGMADTFIRKGVVDFHTHEIKLGTSLEDALKPVAGKIADWRDWIVAKQAKELIRQGKETGLVPSDVDAVLAKFNKDPDFHEAFKKWTDWHDAVLQYAVDAGLVTPESQAAMKKMVSDYVPFHRLFEVGAGEAPSQEALGTGRGLNVGKPGSLKGRHGSTRDIVDPIETSIKNVYAMITSAEKQNINTSVADLANKPEMGKWIERVATPKEKINVSAGKIKDQLAALGADVDSIPDDLVLSFFRNSGKTPFGENIIRITRNGKQELYRLDRDLFDTFNSLDLEDTGKLIKILSGPAKLLRSGVVLAPDFALANALRDTVTSAVLSKYGALPFESTLRGVAAMIGDPKLVAEWAGAGGTSSIETSYFDRQSVQKFLREKITKDLTPAERALVVLKSPLMALRHLASLSEEATRIGEYKIAFNALVKKGMPEGEARRLAAFESRDRQDFAKGGAKTKIPRALTPFWNASLQGTYKLASSLKNRPVRTVLQGLAYITMPKMLEQALNWNDQDYWDLPQWQRDLFFLIPIGKDTNNHTRFLRIPTPFEAGVIFGTLPGRLTQFAKTHNPEALTSYFKVLLQQGLPNPIPPTLLAVFEDFLTGKQGWDTYRGRPIVPDSLADQPPELQWTEQTSATAKKLGGALGYSPLKIDHIISQTAGGSGKIISGQQIPGQRFVTPPLAVSNQSTEDFYNRLSELREEKKRFEAGTVQTYNEDLTQQFEHSAREMSKLRTQMRKSTDKEEKDGLREQIYQIAKEAVKNNSPQ